MSKKRIARLRKALAALQPIAQEVHDCYEEESDFLWQNELLGIMDSLETVDKALEKAIKSY